MRVDKCKKWSEYLCFSAVNGSTVTLVMCTKPGHGGQLHAVCARCDHLRDGAHLSSKLTRAWTSGRVLKWGARKAYINGKGGAQKSKGGTAPLYDALAKALICILASSYSQQMEDTSDSALFMYVYMKLLYTVVFYTCMQAEP